MNSRERVRAVLNGEIPDYVPNGWGGCETAGLHVLAYDKLQNVLNTKKNAPRMSTFMCNAVFERDVIKAMEGDVLLMAAPNLCAAPLWGKDYQTQWKDQSLWGKTFKVPKKDYFKVLPDGKMLWKNNIIFNEDIVCPTGGYYFDLETKSDLLCDFEYPSPDSYNPPHSFSDEMLRNLENTAKALYEQTEYSLSLGETITDLQYRPGGVIGCMVLMMENPDMLREFLYKAVQASLSQLKQIDEAVGKYVDMLLIADDIGDNNSVTIGDNLWRDIYKPFYKELFGQWHKTTNMKINMHSCGSIYSVLGDLIECGVDVLNPVQISANNMSPDKLKTEFGDKIIFMGGAYDAQQYTLTDTYEKVYNSVSSNINIFKQNGGFIFAGVHNLPPDVPEAHMAAMLDAWKDNRKY